MMMNQPNLASKIRCSLIYLVHPQVVKLDDACEMVFNYHSHANDVETNGPVIKRSMNVLTREEACAEC